MEQPPLSTAPELSEYLNRAFILTDVAVRQNHKNIIRYNLPDKPIVGALYYFGAMMPLDPDVTEEGLYVYKSTGYTLLG